MPPINSATVVALGLKASIFPLRVLNSARVISLVRHSADAGVFSECCTKVIMSGVNDKVIMSGCGDDNPDDEEEKRLEIIQRVFRGELTVVEAGVVIGVSERKALPDQSTGNQARSEGSGAWESGQGV